MPDSQTNVIIDGAVVEDQWQLIQLTEDQDPATVTIPVGAVIVPVTLWQARQDELSGREQLGIWLDCDESPKLIADNLDKLQVVAINFPAFADGRGFTYARELREQHGFKGEVRAIGSFMRDQMFYLQRCGFNAYALHNADLEQALASLEDFSDSYQAAIDQPQPLFKRR